MRINYFWKKYLLQDGCKPTVQVKLLKCQLECDIKIPDIIGQNKTKLYFNFQMLHPLRLTSLKRNQYTANSTCDRNF